MLNKHTRYQKGLYMAQLFPSVEGICACGCQRELPKGRKKWFSDECQLQAYFTFAIIKGDNKIIRQSIYNRDKGFCHSCGAYSHNWNADHILPVHQGGGGCSLDNFQTLCQDCHAEKTQHQSIEFHLSKNSLQAASIRESILL